MDQPEPAQRFRKRPVEIDAVLAADAINAATGNVAALPSWLAAAYDNGSVVFTQDAVLLPTLEGTMRAERDDWIIRGVQGELYPCKPAIFAETYQPAADPKPTGRCGNDPRAVLSPGDQDAVDDFKSLLNAKHRADVAEKQRDALHAALYQLRYGMVRASGRDFPAVYIVHLIDTTIADFAGTEAQPCNSAEQHARAQQAETAVERVRGTCQKVRDRVGPGGMINASQILGLLSPTWPDGNFEAPAPAAEDVDNSEVMSASEVYEQDQADERALDADAEAGR